MGDRLISTFRHNDEVIATSYQHWSGGNWKDMENIINNNIKKYKSDDPRADAVNILYNSLVEFDGGNTYMIGLLVNDEEDKKFASLHPEIPSDPKNIGRSYGMISINKEQMELWRDYGDCEIEFEI